MNLTEVPEPNKEPVIQAVEDSAVVAGIGFFAMMSTSALTSLSLESTLISAGIAASTAFLTTYAIKRHINA